jgi:hypothetical protein
MLVYGQRMLMRKRATITWMFAVPGASPVWGDIV